MILRSSIRPVRLVLVLLALLAGYALAGHTVTKGDTLFSIAKRYGVNVSDLRQWNELHGNDIKVGQVLRVQPPASEQRPSAATVNRTVRKGETLWRIAFENGVTVRQLMDLNRIADVGDLKVGQKIRIPVTGTVREKPETRRSFRGQVSGLSVNRPVRGPCEGYKKGVRIYCSRGTPASAVLPGQVEYIGTLVGYKNVVILRHKGEVYSVYAALDDILVRQGQEVRQGQTVGRVEKLSHFDRTFLYFELVANGRNVDPEKHFKD